VPKNDNYLLNNMDLYNNRPYVLDSQGDFIPSDPPTMSESNARDDHKFLLELTTNNDAGDFQGVAFSDYVCRDVNSNYNFDPNTYSDLNLMENDPASLNTFFGSDFN